MELVHMDYQTIEHGKTNQDVNTLVITDHYFFLFFSKYGFPEKIVTDQEAQFEGNLFKELCKVADITKWRTTRYLPQGNGNCERFNSTLIKMITTLE